MAIELCPAETIPRISFSHGFCSSTSSPMKQYCPLPSTSMPLNSTMDFEFDVRANNIDQEFHSSADELFSNGKILPLQIKKNTAPSKQDQERSTPQKPRPQAGINASSRDMEVAIKEANDDEKQSSRSFWQFNRSRSLNFVSGYKRRLFSSSTFLSRSSSTGSAPKVKAGPGLKDSQVIGNHRQKYQKEKSLQFLQSSTSNQKSSLKKSSTYGSLGNGATINPVLNVTSVDVFCLSSVSSYLAKIKRSN